MPFKHNAARSHHIPRARYRARNWPACKAGLERRGSLMLWLDEPALAGWHTPWRSTPDGQPLYSDLTVELVLTLRLVFRLALRQAAAFTASVLRLLGVELPVPDHATLLRCGAPLRAANRACRPATRRGIWSWTALGCNCSARASETPRSTAGESGVG